VTELLDHLNALARSVTGFRPLLLGAGATLLLCVLFGRKAELGRNALRNNAATVLVYMMNYGAMLLFFREINAVAQAAYAALQIPTLPADFWIGSWVIAGLVIGIVMRDFCDYLIHRAMHTRWLFPAHAAHHSDSHVNGLTTFRIHAFEALLMTFSAMFIMTWMQLPEGIPIIALLSLMHNIYVHLDLDWDHGRFRYVLASPVFHRWHHADVPEAYGKNLATLFPVFDLMFGTYYEARYTREPMGALKSGLSDTNPVLIWIYPFQAWGGMLWRGLCRLGTGRRALPPAE
jgi:sterol desaturase/sphingolipid hydroxylase (fatty acid hydroxylase superfamily)